MAKPLWRWLGGFLVLALLFLVGGFWNATRTPRVVEARIALEGLPAGKEIRVLHLSDIHFGYPDMRTARLKRIVEQANALHPDLIVLTGDYIGGKLIDWPGSRLDDALRPLVGLKAPLGVFAVTGNHDQAYWTPWVLERQSRPILLQNAVVDVGPLAVVGLNTAVDNPGRDKPLVGLPPGKPILLIRHEGDFMPFLPHPPNPALALAGHTHGGQVVLPLLGSIGDHWSGRPHCRRGLCQMGKWRVFISSGLGTSVLPIRYGVPPEMAFLTLYAPGKNPSTDR